MDDRPRLNFIEKREEIEWNSFSDKISVSFTSFVTMSAYCFQSCNSRIGGRKNLIFYITLYNEAPMCMSGLKIFSKVIYKTAEGSLINYVINTWHRRTIVSCQFMFKCFYYENSHGVIDEVTKFMDEKKLPNKNNRTNTGRKL